MKKTLTLLIILALIGIGYLIVLILNGKVVNNNLKEFNSQYEMFNKRELYGADVITVINKAINNNQNYNLIEDDEEYYIGVNVRIIDVGYDITVDMKGIVDLRSITIYRIL